MALFKDYYDKTHKTKLPLQYVLIAGIAGVLPDIDIIAFWILSFFSFSFEQVHKTILHSLTIPLLFFLLFLIMPKSKKSNLKLKPKIIFLMISIGSLFHLLLDAIFGELPELFYPLSTQAFGINIITYFPEALQSLVLPSLDAGLLIVWLIYLQYKHKISDFI
jgi:membrane-bound metal-dependent hydrolase YbcI (DUF457 family)